MHVVWLNAVGPRRAKECKQPFANGCVSQLLHVRETLRKSNQVDRSYLVNGKGDLELPPHLALRVLLSLKGEDQGEGCKRFAHFWGTIYERTSRSRQGIHGSLTTRLRFPVIEFLELLLG